ncbi:tryptophan 2,3-dioxygenase family protein [Eisenibacter elegans]|jgi:tryptophan 2,3-dioxygenase|uniref:tryptophan 2,3-dioxygenase family protein n=1 Tax=Eisenibacter elegans TaxID=997 RepID=UPI000410D133|nr:tryptophan 2,3-dioxygenase family protein [Eisenibacter elegans]
MPDYPYSEQTVAKLRALEEKYALTGQSLDDNLEGLLYSDYLKYWDYIHLDTLLSLQTPRTYFPDEMVFIVYHQITELYLKLVRWELEQLGTEAAPEPAFFLSRLGRMERYMTHLCHSFDTMTDGMDVEQFRKFRMSLLPSSGFQSGQFRQIEISSTDLRYLTQNAASETETDLATLLTKLYWRQGATDQSTGKETITSQHFQEKYQETFLATARRFEHCNLWQQYQKIAHLPEAAEIAKALRRWDYMMNVEWRLVHFRTAAKYLKTGAEAVAATGGTNWQQYLPPRFQRTIFYPQLWSAEELAEWGKPWVMERLGQK